MDIRGQVLSICGRGFGAVVLFGTSHIYPVAEDITACEVQGLEFANSHVVNEYPNEFQSWHTICEQACRQSESIVAKVTVAGNQLNGFQARSVAGPDSVQEVGERELC